MEKNTITSFQTELHSRDIKHYELARSCEDAEEDNESTEDHAHDVKLIISDCSSSTEKTQQNDCLLTADSGVRIIRIDSQDQEVEDSTLPSSLEARPRSERSTFQFDSEMDCTGDEDQVNGARTSLSGCSGSSRIAHQDENLSQDNEVLIVVTNPPSQEEQEVGDETSTNGAALKIHLIQNEGTMSLPLNEIIQKDTSDDDSVSTLGSHEKGRSIFGDYWNTSKNGSSSLPKDFQKITLQSQETASSTLSSVNNDSKLFVNIDNLRDFEHITYQEYSLCQSLSVKHTSSSYDYEDIVRENEEGRTSLPCATSLNDKDQIEENELNKNPLIKRQSSGTNRRILFQNKYPERKTSIRSYGYALSSHLEKSLSSSSLILASRRQRPCLRTSSTLNSFSSYTSKLSVSFHPEVSVHEYDKRFEKYAHDGWSSWFH